MTTKQKYIQKDDWDEIYINDSRNVNIMPMCGAESNRNASLSVDWGGGARVSYITISIIMSINVSKIQTDNY